MQETDKEPTPSASEDQRTQNLRYVGLIINAIIHNFNNSIGLIHGYADLSLRATESDNRIYPYLESVLNGAEAMKELSYKMRVLSEQDKQDCTSMSLQGVVEEAIKAFTSATPGAQIQSDLDPNCSAVLANAPQIQQAVINLCHNAYDAVQENNGTITVLLKEVDVDAALAEGQEDLEEGKYVKLTVSDTGCGMDEEVSESVFEPFFTTKNEQSAGIGLTVVRGIAKHHKGAVMVTSKQGAGATFDVYFPLGDSNKG